MRLTALNVILGVILAALAALHWLGQRNYLQPNYEVMPDMVDPVPYETFAPNPNFADGKTLQPPPAGTIARDMLPLPYRATPEDAGRAGRDLSNPFAATDQAAIDRGSVVYRRFCLPCHGPTGAGDGPVARRGFPPPPPLDADHARGLADGQIFHIITFGQGNMPPHAAQTAPDDRWRAVLHVRGMQQRSAPAIAAAETP